MMTLAFSCVHERFYVKWSPRTSREPPFWNYRFPTTRPALGPGLCWLGKQSVPRTSAAHIMNRNQQEKKMGTIYEKNKATLSSMLEIMGNPMPLTGSASS